jgi:hypothetical protein
MKISIFILAAIMLIGLLPVTACQQSEPVSHTYLPSYTSSANTTEEAADDIVATPGSSAYRANVHQQGVENPWPPIEMKTMSLGNKPDIIRVMYREHITTEAGETRNNILYINRTEGFFENISSDVRLYSDDIPDGISLFRSNGGGLIGQLVSILRIVISPVATPGQYTLEIGVEIKGKDYGTIPCTVQVTESPEDTTALNNNYRSNANYLSVNLPDGWAAAEGPGHIVVMSHLEGQVSFNSWGEAGFWSREEVHGTRHTYGPMTVMNSLPPGGAYIVLVKTVMPPNPDSEPEEDSQNDLSGLLTPRDWRLDSGFSYFGFSKWGESYDLQIACDPAATDATIEQVNSILESWRFDKYPAGNVGWAIVFARELIPDAVQPFPRYTGSFSSGKNDGVVRSIDSDVGEDKTVHFRFTYHWNVPSLGSSRDNLASSPRHWWDVDVSPKGKAVLAGEGGDALP